jgi:hypothetical protein
VHLEEKREMGRWGEERRRDEEMRRGGRASKGRERRKRVDQ